MNIEAIADFRSPISGKFAVPRQPGIAPSLKGEVVLRAPYNSPDALRGLEDFDYIWLIWGFSLNEGKYGSPADSGDGSIHKTFTATVRPPRLGGNRRTGIFASRSPFRPNPLGLSAVRLVKVDSSRGIIEVAGADLADGTPIYDIKPYVEYADSYSGIRSGFVDTADWGTLEVEFAEGSCPGLDQEGKNALREILTQDPRPPFHNDPERIYGFSFSGREIHFIVEGKRLTVLAEDDTRVTSRRK